MEGVATREAMSVEAVHAATGTPRGAGWAGVVADGPVLLRTRERKMPVEGRGPELGAVRKGGRDLTTDGSLRGSAGSVRKLQNVLHAKAKEEPDRRFHALVDKVWRQDFLLEAWGMVRRNGGAAGVDGVTVADVEAYGALERWVGELSRDLRDGAYEPSPVRQVLIPKKQPGKFRPRRHQILPLRSRLKSDSAPTNLTLHTALMPEGIGADS